MNAWNTTAAVRCPRLPEDLDVEVANVGECNTGSTMALQRVRAGLSVAVSDQQTVAAGATGDSTGHLTSCLDVGCSQLCGQSGEGGERLLAQSSMAAITVEPAPLRGHEVG